MDKRIIDLMKRIYIEKDYDYFIKKCQETLYLSEEIKTYAEKLNFNIFEYNQHDLPCAEYIIETNKTIVDDFETDYSTELKISKVGKIFYIGHSFCFDYKCVKDMDSYLRGDGETPYIKEQKLLDEYIDKCLKKQGYIRITQEEMDKSVFDIRREYGEKDLNFGNQISVFNGLFFDYLYLTDVLEEEEDEW